MSRAMNRGFSLVEVMVAMTLSLILLGGVLSVLYSSKVTYNENERVGRLQENGRAAIELMLRDMRASGYHGCTQTVTFESTLNNKTDMLWDFTAPVQGYASTAPGSWTPTLDPLIDSPRDGSDVIAVRTVRSNKPSFATNAAMGSTTASLTVARSAGDTLTNGQVVLVSDCKAAVVFAVSNFDNSDPITAQIDHGAGGAVANVGPGNSTDDLGFDFPLNSQVVPLDTVVYYIRDSATKRKLGTGPDYYNPALWRKIGAADAQELIEGIEAMQIRYGVDTDGDRLVNSYVTADAVANWSSVISISFALLIRSVEPNAPETDSRTYTLLGTDVGPFGDRYERTLYTTTVALRNTTS